MTQDLLTLSELTLTAVAVVDAATPVTEIARLFVDLRVPVVLVQDDAGVLHGLVTRTDVLRSLDAPHAIAGDVMSCYVFALSAESTLECAAALMAIEGVGQVIVIDDEGGALGVVTSLDIARHVALRAGYLAA